MEISIHTSGQRTLVGTKSAEGIEIKAIDSRFLFQKQELLSERLMALLEKKFGLKDPKEITSMAFGFHGIMHSPSGSVIHSDVLNDISRGKGYSGFSFRELFGHICGPENVHVVNDTVPIGLGFQSLYPAISKPVLAIMIAQHGVGVSIINSLGEVIATELGNTRLPKYFWKNAHDLLVHRGVTKLLNSSSKDIMKEYTKGLIYVASFFRDISDSVIYATHTKDRARLNVCVHPRGDEYIDTEMLQNNGSDLEFIIPQTEDEKLKIPILGLFAYSDYKSPARTIQRIEYYSRNVKLYTFSTYEDFAEHWGQVKSFANPENEYRLYYSDGIIRPVKISEISYEIQLEAYKF